MERNQIFSYFRMQKNKISFFFVFLQIVLKADTVAISNSNAAAVYYCTTNCISKMNKKKTTAGLIIIGVGLIMASCGSSEAMVDSATMLTYGKEPTEQNLENLAKNYGSVINKNRKSGIKRPGIYSDYAVALARQGKHAEANNWFNTEMATFPSSRGYVMQLKKKMIPEYIDDNSISSNSAPETDESGLSPKKRVAAEERASGVMETEKREMDAEKKATDEEKSVMNTEKKD